MEDLQPFTTSDTPFAAYLRYHDQTPLGVKQDDNDPRRLLYVFVKTPDIEVLKREYYGGDCSLNLGRYYTHIRFVHALLKEKK